MKRSKSIQINAALLLLVFLMNTVIGFACAVGLNMGFNAKHHQNEEATEAVVHLHQNGKKHLHQEKSESHSHTTPHHKTAGTNDNSKSNDDCCSNKVSNFTKLYKTVPNTQSFVAPMFLKAFAGTYYRLNILSSADVTKDMKFFVRSYHPPISDIRIAIQSFQI